jgi:hypothetical protein
VVAVAVLELADQSLANSQLIVLKKRFVLLRLNKEKFDANLLYRYFTGHEF